MNIKSICDPLSIDVGYISTVYKKKTHRALDMQKNTQTRSRFTYKKEGNGIIRKKREPVLGSLVAEFIASLLSLLGCDQRPCWLQSRCAQLPSSTVISRLVSWHRHQRLHSILGARLAKFPRQPTLAALVHRQQHQSVQRYLVAPEHKLGLVHVFATQLLSNTQTNRGCYALPDCLDVMPTNPLRSTSFIAPASYFFYRFLKCSVGPEAHPTFSYCGRSLQNACCAYSSIPPLDRCSTLTALHAPLASHANILSVTLVSCRLP